MIKPHQPEQEMSFQQKTDPKDEESKDNMLVNDSSILAGSKRSNPEPVGVTSTKRKKHKDMPRRK